MDHTKVIVSTLPRVDYKLIPGQPPEEITEDNAYTGQYIRMVYKEISRSYENLAIYELWSLEVVDCE